MSLYLVWFDGEQYYVEADSYGQAVHLWKLHINDLDQPESVSLVYRTRPGEPIIRAKASEPEEVKR